jgi:hypothetical protein
MLYRIRTVAAAQVANAQNVLALKELVIQIAAKALVVQQNQLVVQKTKQVVLNN